MTDNNAGSRRFGPVTDTDRARWQQRAITDLTRILTDDRAAGLPVLTWLVTTTGTLAGQVSPTGAAADQRAAFGAWTKHLGLSRWPERTNHDGWLHLHAVGKLPGGTTVAVTAVIDSGGDGLNADPTVEEC